MKEYLLVISGSGGISILPSRVVLTNLNEYRDQKLTSLSDFIGTLIKTVDPDTLTELLKNHGFTMKDTEEHDTVYKRFQEHHGEKIYGYGNRCSCDDCRLDAR